MANVQIPNLPAVVNISGEEQIEAVQAGTSVRITAQQIADLIQLPDVPAGPTFSLQYNSYGNFAGSSGVTTDGYSRINLGVDGSTQGELRLNNTASGSKYTAIKSSNTNSQAWTLTLPTSPGINNYILTTDGTGVSSWTNLASIGVTSFSAGTTGLTPSVAATGAVTLAGTLGVTNGGTGTSTAFTTGSVVFAGVSGAYSQDNSNFNWDNTNKRLRIGSVVTSSSLTTSSADGIFQFAAVGTTKAVRFFSAPTEYVIDGVDSTLTGSYQPLSVGGSTTTLRYNGNAGLVLDVGGNVTVGAGSITTGTQGLTGVHGSLVLANTANGSFATTIRSSNSSTSAWTLTLPPAAPAGNSYVLTSTTGGVASWSSPTSLGIDIDVGSTAITNGTTGSLVYNNAGVVGEISVGSAGTILRSNGTNWAASSVTYVDSGTSGGIPYYSSSTAISSSAILSSGAVVVGGGSGAAPFVDATNLTWDNTNKRLKVGPTATSASLTASAADGVYQFVAVGTTKAVRFASTPTEYLIEGVDNNISATYQPISIGGSITTLRYNGNAGLVLDGSGNVTVGVGSITSGTQGLTGVQGSLVLANTANGSFATTIRSSNSSTSAWTLTLPTSVPAANGYVLTSTTSGVASWTAPSSLASLLTVGTTATSGGASGQIMFDTGSVLQESSSLTWNDTTKTLTAVGLGTGGGANTGGLTVSGGSFVLSGNISANAWTTNGIRYRNVPATLTDLTSTGTVAAAYTNAYGGNTIAASNATTYTEYFTTYITEPTAGSNVTFTSRWALGITGNAKFSGSLTLGTPLALSSGGTNANLTASNGGIIYSTATAMAVLSGTATAGQILRSGSSAAPSWSTATYPATTTINRILFSSANNTISEISTTNGGLLNAGATGVPSMTVTPVLGVAGTSTGTLGLSGATSGVVTISPATAAGTWTFTLPTNGGTSGYALTTNGSGTSSWDILGVAGGGTGTATAFTSGSVVFAGASGTYSQDNSNFNWDNTNKRLRVGSTALSARLATTAADGTFQFAASGTSKAVRFVSTATDYRLEGVDNSLTASYQPLSLLGSALNFENAAGLVFNIDSSGNATIGTGALATTATNGFLYIPSCAGAPTGVPTSKTGRVPIVYDSTNDRIYIYDGAWRYATTTV